MDELEEFTEIASTDLLAARLQRQHEQDFKDNPPKNCETCHVPMKWVRTEVRIIDADDGDAKIGYLATETCDCGAKGRRRALKGTLPVYVPPIKCPKCNMTNAKKSMNVDTFQPGIRCPTCGFIPLEALLDASRKA